MLKRSKEILKAAYLIALGVLKNRYGATIVLALGWVIFISDIDLGFIIQEQIELNKMKSEVRSTIKKNDEIIVKPNDEHEKNEVVIKQKNTKYNLLY